MYSKGSGEPAQGGNLAASESVAGDGVADPAVSTLDLLVGEVVAAGGGVHAVAGASVSSAEEEARSREIGTHPMKLV